MDFSGAMGDNSVVRIDTLKKPLVCADYGGSMGYVMRKGSSKTSARSVEKDGKLIILRRPITKTNEKQIPAAVYNTSK